MATDGWRSARALGEQLVEDFASFDYYQLLRLCRRRLRRADDRADTDLETRLRVRADLSAAFPGFEVSALEYDEAQTRITLQTPNYCVAGSSGPLPAPFVDWLRELVADGQRAMADFFDVFNRRLHLMRWRIKSRLHPGLHDDHPDRSDYAIYLASVIGLLDPALVDALSPVPRRALLGLAGLLSDARRSVPAFTQALSLLIGAQVRLEPLVGRWLPIDECERNGLGRINSRLGRDLLLGRRWFDAGAAVEVHVAPLPYEQVCRLLPNGSGHPALRTLLRFLSERRFDVWMVFGVQPNTAQPVRLRRDPRSNEPRLGYTAVPNHARAASSRIDSIRVLFPAFDATETLEPAAA
jgi:type VI secretion system protein ImpH